MNKSVNPLLALIIIIVFGGLFALKTYFYQKAIEVHRVTFIKTSPTGNVVIRLGAELYEYSVSGEFKRVINLHNIGITDGYGDFALFSNGDLLINRDQHLPALSDKLQSFGRVANTDQTVAKQGKGLHRCNLQQASCELFTRKIPALQDVHHLFIDPETDTVYLADTRRHQLRKLDKNGGLLAESSTKLNFPNQLWLNQDSLWVVDTNNHVMKAVQASTDTFGKLIEEHKVMTTFPWIWPSAFSRVQENWWVNISDSAMADAKVVIFDKQWEKLKTLELPGNADPVSLLMLSDSVLIADASQYALYQFDFEGNRLPDFALQEEEGEGIQATLQGNKQENKQYLLWSDYSLWVGIALFIPLFIYALVLAKKDVAVKQNESANLEINMAQLNALPNEGVWLEARRSIIRIQRAGLISTACLVILLIAGFFAYEGELPQELLLLGISFPLFSLILISGRRLSKLRIGFFKDRVTIKTDKGRSLTAPYNKIKWHPRAFVIGDWVVPIGNPAQSMFPYQQLHDNLMPYVLDSNRLSSLELMAYQWHSPDATLKNSVLIMLLATALIVFIKKAEILAFIANLAMII